MSIEKRIENLEMHIPREVGHEVLIEHQDGSVTRFYQGDGPPWEKRTIIHTAFEMNEEERKRFDEGLLSLYEGKRPLPNTKP